MDICPCFPCFISSCVGTGLAVGLPFPRYPTDYPADIKREKQDSKISGNEARFLSLSSSPLEFSVSGVCRGKSIHLIS
jgi:hypothetical protein